MKFLKLFYITLLLLSSVAFCFSLGNAQKAEILNSLIVIELQSITWNQQLDELEENKIEKEKLLNDYKTTNYNLKNDIMNLENLIADLNNQIENRAKLLNEAEKQIAELKKKLKELEQSSWKNKLTIGGFCLGAGIVIGIIIGVKAFK